MPKPRLLDLFCGAGGAAAGYTFAGFDVTGVDIDPQPRYPYEFIQADALTFPLDGYDYIHASPPCQHYSKLRAIHGNKDEHPDLIAPTRERLKASGRPYIIENVVGAPLMHNHDILLCGTMFGLMGTQAGRAHQLIRHRHFESNVPLFAPSRCMHRRGIPVLQVYGNGSGPNSKAAWSEGMEIDWMSQLELAEAIPPAYTKWIGRLLLTRAYIPT